MADCPEDLLYTRQHEWARVEGTRVRVGVTRYAVDQLGDVTLVDLPKVGSQVTAAQRFGDIESVKTVSELFAPLSGTVVEINAELETQAEKVNASPYDQGWLMLVEPSAAEPLQSLMTAAAYRDYLSGLEH